MSAAPKFTPGPWHQQRAGHSHRLFIRGDERLSVTAVAMVCARLDQNANAALIAAAPDLYYALSDFMDAHKRDDRRALHHAMRAAETALDRVEGSR